MNNRQQRIILPFKSVAGALLFSLFLGPIGLLYSSVWGGVALLVLGLLALSHKLYGVLILVWLLGCVWAVVAANRYNQKIFCHFDSGHFREESLTP